MYRKKVTQAKNQTRQFLSPRHYLASAAQYCSKTNDASGRLSRLYVWLLFNLGQLTLEDAGLHISA